ncbi:MAG TPA: hypothetical protein VM118_14270, partial [Acidobacteriota bacterium]|nr:hypothetical protein [Acidobacteriota bacterium]
MDIGRIRAVALVLTVGLCLPVPSAYAVNTVVVQSKSVSPGATGVSVGVLVSNDVALDLVAVPLEIRTIIGGAFVSGTFTLAPQGRIEVGVLDNRILYYYADPDVSNSCSGPLSSTWSSGSSSPQANGSPDAVLWIGIRMSGASLPPGFDAGVPSLNFTLDIDTVPGSFEIDTMCVAPALQHLQFVNDVGTDIPVAFTKGVITVEAVGNMCPIGVTPTIDPVEVEVGDVAVNQITAIDLEGDPIEYFLVSGPGVVGQTTGEWMWIPDCSEGAYVVEIEATDRGAGGCPDAIASFDVIVDVPPLDTDCGGGVTVPWGQTATQEIFAFGGCPPYWFFQLSGPGVIDPNSGVWMFPTTCSNAGHTYMVEVEVYDYHERNSVCTLFVEVTNSPLECSPV